MVHVIEELDRSGHLSLIEVPDGKAQMDIETTEDLIRNRVEEGLRLAAALAEFWYVRGYAAEGRERLVARACAQCECTCRTEARCL
jgi:hypothetical protein